MHPQNDRWGLGPKKTSISDANHDVLHAQNDRWGLGPMETSDSGANHDVLHAQNHKWGLGPTETSNSDAEALFWMQKSIGEVWDPWRLVILVLKALFFIQKPQMRAGTNGD